MAPIARSVVTAIAAAVPARDEAGSIATCIAALAQAAARVDVPVHLVVAADCCSDDTPGLARQAIERSSMQGVVIELDEGSAGAARNRAASLAISSAASAGHPLEHVWLVTTDADSRVDPDWLATHQRWADRGLAAVTGLVTLADGDLDLRRRYDDHMSRRGITQGHDHVHGANLGVRADWWAAVGGFPGIESGEDHGLWQRLIAAGADVLGVTDLGVTTSARLTGRAPGGLADLLTSISL